MSQDMPVLVLTPVKNAASFLEVYFGLLSRLDYPADCLSIGILESDSGDDTFASCQHCLGALSSRFRRSNVWKRDFGFRLGDISRHDPAVQLRRRAVLAKARNHLLFNALEPDDEWVLWLDVDLVDYAPSTLRQLLAAGKEIVQPDCVQKPATLEHHRGMMSYDRNAWKDHGTLHLEDLRGANDIVQIDSVGASMLLIRADRHRDGLIFPSYPYGLPSPQIRPMGRNHWEGEIETEGLGMMAANAGVLCWGMPNLRVIHR